MTILHHDKFRARTVSEIEFGVLEHITTRLEARGRDPEVIVMVGAIIERLVRDLDRAWPGFRRVIMQRLQSTGQPEDQ